MGKVKQEAIKLVETKTLSPGEKYNNQYYFKTYGTIEGEELIYADNLQNAEYVLWGKLQSNDITDEITHWDDASTISVKPNPYQVKPTPQEVKQ